MIQAPAFDNALHMMETTGGSFVRSLAECWYRADSDNKRRLREAFADYFESYEQRYCDHLEFIESRRRAAASIGETP